MENLVAMMDGFTGREKKVLVGILNRYSEHTTITLASLPFFNRERCIEILNFAVENDSGVNETTIKTWHTLLAKVSSANVKGKCTFQIFMDLKLVRHRWKKVGDKDYELETPITTKKECGLKWQEFGKKHVREEKILKVMVRATHVKGELWTVTTDASVKGAVVNFLFEKYGVTT